MWHDAKKISQVKHEAEVLRQRILLPSGSSRRTSSIGRCSEKKENNHVREVQAACRDVKMTKTYRRTSEARYNVERKKQRSIAQSVEEITQFRRKIS